MTILHRSLIFTALCLLIACDRSTPTPAPTTQEAPPEAVAPVKEQAPAAPSPTAMAAPEAPIQDWDKLLEAEPRWREAYAQSELEPPILKGLLQVKPGAVVTIVYGSWCGDSRREVPPLMKHLLLAKAPPFQWSAINVARGFKSSADLSSLNIRYVPTIIVTRDGEEVGRIVESSIHGAAQDLLSLLDGSTMGVISKRDDL